MMKLWIASSCLVLSTLAASAQVHVDGHIRKDGTYVAPHYRSSPDRSYNNNYGTSPNVNPYTGQQGTSQPTWNDRPPPTNKPYGTQRKW